MTILGLGFLLGLGGIGLIFILLGLVFQLKYWRISHWPVAEGVVVSSSLKTNQGVGASDGAPQPVVMYHFDVGGRAHNSTMIRTGTRRISHEAAKKIVERYAPGTRVNVHYNLENPQDCMLEIPQTGGVLLLIMGVVFAGLGIVVGGSLLGWKIY